MAIKRVAKPIEEIEDELEEMEDDEEYEDNEEYEDRSRLVPFLLLSVALLAFGGLGWYAYQAGSSTDAEDLMLVEAEQTPIKERPLDAGGMQFPHQDKSVFETIAGGEVAADNAQVVNNTEEPIQQVPADVTASTLASEVPAAEAPAETIAAIEPAAAAPEPQEVKEVPVASVKEVAPIVEAKLQQPKAKIASPAASGSQIVQLGAFKSEEEARAAWKKVSGNAALSGKSPNIIMADLGDKGIFYRLRVGGVNAKATCASLAGKSPCMAVK